MLPVLVAFLWRWLLIDTILIEDFEKVRNDAIIAIVYKRQGFSCKCRSCGSDVVRGFDDTLVFEGNNSYWKKTVGLSIQLSVKALSWWFLLPPQDLSVACVVCLSSSVTPGVILCYYEVFGSYCKLLLFRIIIQAEKYNMTILWINILHFRRLPS